MADEEGEDDAAQAFEELRAEVTLMRRAVERLTAERLEVPEPVDYSETLGKIAKLAAATFQKVDAVAGSPALAMTPERMAQRIAAAGNAARREDQAVLARAGEDKASVMAELRDITGSAWIKHDQKKRQLRFGLGGVVIGILAWAIVPGLVARELAPASWQWPERMAARTLDRPMWEAGRHLLIMDAPESWRAIVAGDRIVTANRETIEGCEKAATKAGDTVRCTIRVGGDP